MSHFVGSSVDNAMRRSYCGGLSGSDFSLFAFALRQKERAFCLKLGQGWMEKQDSRGGGEEDRRDRVFQD